MAPRSPCCSAGTSIPGDPSSAGGRSILTASAVVRPIAREQLDRLVQTRRIRAAAASDTGLHSTGSVASRATILDAVAPHRVDLAVMRQASAQAAHDASSEPCSSHSADGRSRTG